jgi:Xaa-Pro dipeptidase
MAASNLEAVCYQQRVRELQQLMAAHGFDAALVLQPRDLYYFAGTAQPANLWIPAKGDPVLFTRRAHAMTREATWISRTAQANTFAAMIASLSEWGLRPDPGATVGVESDVLPASMMDGLSREFPGIRLQNISPLLLRQRLRKDETETRKIRAAVEAWKAGHRMILEHLAPGKTEYEVAAAMEYGVRRAGGDGVVWFRRWDACLPGGGIVASGPHAWVVSGHAMTVTGVGMSQGLPWGASQRQVQKGDLVVVDYGVSRESYHCDMARTYCVGKPGDDQKDLWKRLLEVHDAVIAHIKPGVTGEELYAVAANMAEKMGMSDYFMGVHPATGSYIGHSIGLELDEWPVLGKGARDPLPPGAVVTVEPKFMVPGRGAVMVEDDILVTSQGHEIISTLDRELFYV